MNITCLNNNNINKNIIQWYKNLFCRWKLSTAYLWIYDKAIVFPALCLKYELIKIIMGIAIYIISNRPECFGTLIIKTEGIMNFESPIISFILFITLCKITCNHRTFPPALAGFWAPKPLISKIVTGVACDATDTI